MLYSGDIFYLKFLEDFRFDENNYICISLEFLFSL